MRDTTSCPRCGAARRRNTPPGTPCPSCLLSGALLTPVVPPLADREESLLRYLRILNVIGEGPRARVYLAEWLPPASGFAAVKRLSSAQSCDVDSESRQRLLALDHPNVAAVFDYGLDDQGHLYRVTEYVAGMPLPDLCIQQNVEMPRRIELLMQVTSALEYASSRGVHHANLKASNVLVSRSADVVKLLDFDVAMSQPPVEIRGAATPASALPTLSALVGAVLGETALASKRYESVRDIRDDLISTLARQVA